MTVPFTRTATVALAQPPDTQTPALQPFTTARLPMPSTITTNTHHPLRPGSYRSFARRDVQTLELVGRFRFLERHQLQALLFADTPVTERSAEVMTRRVLHRLVQRRLLARTSRQLGGPAGGSAAPVHYLTTAGAALLGETPLPPRAPRGMLLLRHALATADVVLAFDRAARTHPGHALLGWANDRDIGAELGPLPLLPDLYLVYAAAHLEVHLFIEIDLGSESSRVIATKIDRYLQLWRQGSVQEQLGIWPVIAWVTTTPIRARLLETAITRVHAAQPDGEAVARGTEFAVTTIGQLERDGPLAPIWQIVGRPDDHTIHTPHPQVTS